MNYTNTYIKSKLSFFIILITLGFIGSANAQSQYESGMKKAFDLYSDAKPMDASAMFERIAIAEKDNWIPYYYAAQTLITASFETKDVTFVNEILKKADTFIKAGEKISPDNSELITLEGLLYTGYVAMDPQAFGMVYSDKINNLHTRAIKLDESNPRAHLNKIEYAMGAARFFGQDLSKFCESIKETRSLFENQETSEPFYPEHGEDRVDILLKQCKCD
jgi:hypothetical protein